MVERRARSINWSLDRRRIGAIVWSVDRRRISAISIVIAGIAALSVCQWYVAVQCGTYSRCHVAVRCQCRVGSIGRSAQSLVIGLVHRHISVVSYQFKFVYISARGLSNHKAYQLQQLSGS